VQKKHFGNTIESLVCSFLEANQLTFVERNFSCRLGEIDLIMFEVSSNSLVFVEVRFRANAHHGNATESVDWKKQRKLRRTVMHYLQRNATARINARIDVVGVCKTDSTDPDSTNHCMSLSAHGVSRHYFANHLLIWTRNAIEDA